MTVRAVGNGVEAEPPPGSAEAGAAPAAGVAAPPLPLSATPQSLVGLGACVAVRGSQLISAGMGVRSR